MGYIRRDQIISHPNSSVSTTEVLVKLSSKRHTSAPPLFWGQKLGFFLQFKMQ